MNGNRSWRGSAGVARGRRRLSERRRRFAPRERSCFVGESLALCTDEHAIGAHLIIDTERDPVVVPEIKLGRIAMQVRLADVEVTAVDAALEDRKEVLDRVGVPESGPNIFLGGMIDGPVAGELIAHRPADRSIISHQVAGFVHVRDDDRLQGVRRYIRDVKAAYSTVALDEHQHRSLGRDFALPVCRPAADIGFVGLDNLILAAERRVGLIDFQHGHRLADAMTEEPCGLEAATERTVKLSGRDALPAATHQIDRLKPNMHRDVARLEHGPHAHRERLVACPTFPKAGARRLSSKLGSLAYRSAMRAHRTVWPKPAFNISDGGFFVGKLGASRMDCMADFLVPLPFYL